MGVANPLNRKDRAANGVLTSFDFDFKIFNTSDLLIYDVDADDVATLKTETTQYTVTLDDSVEGGTVNTLYVPVNGHTIRMIGAIPITQETEFPIGTGFSEARIRIVADKLTRLISQLQDQLDLAITLPISASSDDVVSVASLAASVALASGYATAAAASATTAGASATTAAASASTATTAKNAAQTAQAAAEAALASALAAIAAIPAQVGLGSWAAKSFATSYLAATDGFVVGWFEADNGDNVYVYTDASNPPTTARQRMGTDSGTSEAILSFMCPVKKNDYYKVEASSGSVGGSAGGTTNAIFFIPLGS